MLKGRKVDILFGGAVDWERKTNIQIKKRKKKRLLSGSQKLPFGSALFLHEATTLAKYLYFNRNTSIFPLFVLPLSFISPIVTRRARICLALSLEQDNKLATIEELTPSGCSPKNKITLSSSLDKLLFNSIN